MLRRPRVGATTLSSWTKRSTGSANFPASLISSMIRLNTLLELVEDLFGYTFGAMLGIFDVVDEQKLD